MPPPPAPDAVNTTAWLIAGFVGEKVKLAACAVSTPDTATVREAVDDAPVLLATVSVTLKDAARLKRWVTFEIGRAHV